jgi:lipopolysaccharide/colanic/teichoic acid biosynthesis glycosyltransferase
MYLETYPLAVNAEQQWINFDHLAYESRRKSSLTFLYVGSYNESLQYFSSFFISGIFADDLSRAKLVIDQLLANKDKLPDTIVIDVPFNKISLELFSTYLGEKNLAGKISVIYNEKQLDREKITMIQQLGLVDDITDVSSWETNFSKKVAFLKKFKNHPPALHLAHKTLPVYEGAANKELPLPKRIFDIVIASILIVALLPVFLLIAMAIRLESNGPVIFTSSRAGRGFKVFKFFKFRTMEVNADQKIDAVAHLNQYGKSEKGARFLKICNDPRVTKVGKFLRKTSLDELPQLFNVLKGDMSLVGNRPLPIYEATTLTTNEFAERFMAPAGITGLWQIKKRGRSEMSAEERINLDIQYARKYSLLMDMSIIIQTPFALFQKCNV